MSLERSDWTWPEGLQDTSRASWAGATGGLADIYREASPILPSADSTLVLSSHNIAWPLQQQSSPGIICPFQLFSNILDPIMSQPEPHDPDAVQSHQSQQNGAQLFQYNRNTVHGNRHNQNVVQPYQPNQNVAQPYQANQNVALSHPHYQYAVQPHQYNQNTTQSHLPDQNVVQTYQHNQNVIPSNQYHPNIVQWRQQSQDVVPSYQFCQNVPPPQEFYQNIPPPNQFYQNVPQSAQPSQNVVPPHQHASQPHRYHHDVVQPPQHSAKIGQHNQHNSRVHQPKQHKVEVIQAHQLGQNVVQPRQGNQNVVRSKQHNQNVVQLHHPNQNVAQSPQPNQNVVQPGQQNRKVDKRFPGNKNRHRTRAQNQHAIKFRPQNEPVTEARPEFNQAKAGRVKILRRQDTRTDDIVRQEKQKEELSTEEAHGELENLNLVDVREGKVQEDQHVREMREEEEITGEDMEHEEMGAMGGESEQHEGRRRVRHIGSLENERERETAKGTEAEKGGERDVIRDHPANQRENAELDFVEDHCLEEVDDQGILGIQDFAAHVGWFKQPENPFEHLSQKSWINSNRHRTTTGCGPYSWRIPERDTPISMKIPLSEEQLVDERIANNIHGTFDPQRANELCGFFQRDREQGQLVDLTVVNGQQTSRIHRAVLYSISDYFQGLFTYNKFYGINTEVLIVDNIGPYEDRAEIFSVILDYAYTGCLNLTTDNIQSVTEAVHYFNMKESTMNICEEFMICHLDEENVCPVLCFAYNYSCKLLKKETGNYIARQLRSMFETTPFLELPPYMVQDLFQRDDIVIMDSDPVPLKTVDRELAILEAVLCYLSANYAHDLNICQQLLQTVRFLDIPPKRVRGVCRAYKLMTNNIVLQGLMSLGQSLANIGINKNISHITDSLPLSWAGRRTLYRWWFEETNIQDLRYHINPGMATTSSVIQDSSIEIMSIRLFIRKIDQRDMIGGLEVAYRNRVNKKEVLKYCAGCLTPAESTAFIRLKENEHITGVGVEAEGKYVWSMSFRTSLNSTHGPYGGQNKQLILQRATGVRLYHLYAIDCDSTFVQRTEVVVNMKMRWVCFQ